MQKEDTMRLDIFSHKIVKLPVSVVGTMIDHYADHSQLPYLGTCINAIVGIQEDYSTWSLSLRDVKLLHGRIEGLTGHRKGVIDAIRANMVDHFKTKCVVAERQQLIDYMWKRQKSQFLAVVQKDITSRNPYTKKVTCRKLCLRCLRDYETGKVLTDHVWVHLPKGLFQGVYTKGQCIAFFAYPKTYHSGDQISITVAGLSGARIMPIDALRQWAAERNLQKSSK